LTYASPFLIFPFKPFARFPAHRLTMILLVWLATDISPCRSIGTDPSRGHFPGEQWSSGFFLRPAFSEQVLGRSDIAGL
jgi:hypothetical protein